MKALQRLIAVLWLAALLGANASAAPDAQRYAVLVGVSQLAYQPRSLWLEGPRHDVAAVQALLATQGIGPARTTLLADGLPGATPPTLAAILAALDALTPRLQPGDSVLLYWSGHGVRGPAPPDAAKASQEPDGLDEYLLARDAQIDRRAGAPVLQGALRDAAIGARIDAWQARGAQVFAVFDTCHAASSTRADAPAGLRWRGLEIGQLRGAAKAASLAALSQALPAPRPRPAYVAFYASESHQRTPEWKGVGLFTQALLAAWSGGAADYRGLAGATLQQYQRLAASLPIARSAWPSPQFEGDLDAPLWGRSPARRDDIGKAASSGSTHTTLPDGVQARLTLQRPGQAAQMLNVADADADLGRLPAGTLLTLAVLNGSGASLDMALAYHAAGQPAQRLYPALTGDSNRLEAGTPGAPARWEQAFTLTDDGAAGEALVLTLAPARAHSLPRRFGHDDSAEPAAWQARLRWQVMPAKDQAKSASSPG